MVNLKLKSARLVLAALAILVGCSRPNLPVPPPPTVVTPARPANLPTNTPSPVVSESPPVASTETKSELPIGPPKTAVDQELRALVEKLARKEGKKWTINEEAKARLEALGPAAVDQLLPLLSDESVDVRRGAAFQLLPVANSRDDLAQAFTHLLGDADVSIRGIALAAVGQFKPAQKVAASADIARLLANEQGDEQQRVAAAKLLGDIGNEAAAYLPRLAALAANDSSVAVRSAVLLAISKIAEPGAAVGLLVKSLADRDAAVRLAALRRLRELGREAAPAATELGQLLDDQDEKVRRTAAEALVRIGSPSVPIFTAHLASKSSETRELCAYALGKMGSVAKPALPELKKRLGDSDAKVKAAAQVAIVEIELQ